MVFEGNTQDTDLFFKRKVSAYNVSFPFFKEKPKMNIDFYGVVWRYQFAPTVAPLKVPTNNAKLPDREERAWKNIDYMLKHCCLAFKMLRIAGEKEPSSIDRK